MKEKFRIYINRQNVHYGDKVKQVRDMFSRKQENTSKQDDKFFSKYWQVYAWCSIIGFLKGKREEDAVLPNQSSFQYQMISNGSEHIANALVLIAISKINAKNSEEILDARRILTIISEYAEGGAKYVLELRETQGKERMFDSADDYFWEITERNIKVEPIS